MFWAFEAAKLVETSKQQNAAWSWMKNLKMKLNSAREKLKYF